jgi:hypothetical protein
MNSGEDCSNIKKVFLSENIKSNISKNELLLAYCHLRENNNIILDYKYFKLIRKLNCMENRTIIEHMITIFQKALEKNEIFNIHFCLKTLTISDIDQYYSIIREMSEIFKMKFPDKLEECFIYNAPFIFTQFIKIVSVFADKKTMNKMKLVE